MATRRTFAPLALALAGGLGLLACAAQPRTTRLQVDDFQAMAADMAQSLASSAALQGRGPDSPRWVVSIDKVQNLSSDVMTRSEQWAIMAMIVGAQPIRALWRQKNVRFILPPERVAAMGQKDAAFAPSTGFAADRRVTHTMAATFRSATRATANQRTDLYYCQFEMIPLGGGAPVWSGRFEFKRAAVGQIRD